MKVMLPLWVLFYFCCSPLFSAEWLGVYGGEKSESVFTTVDDGSGGFIVIGETNSYGAGSEDLYLIGLDSLGDSLWYKTYGTEKGESIRAVRGSIDKGLFILISSYLVGDDEIPAYVLYNMDRNGEPLWEKVLTSSHVGRFIDMDINRDMEPVLLCKDSAKNYVFTTYSSEGNPRDTVTTILESNPTITTMRIDSKNRPVLFGNCYDSLEVNGELKGIRCAYLAKIDYEDGIISEETYTVDSLVSFDARSFVLTRDGGAVLMGQVRGYSELSMSIAEVALIKVDKHGTKAWEQVFCDHVENYCSFVYEFPNGDIRFSGSTHNGVNMEAGFNSYFPKVDSAGNKPKKRGVLDEWDLWPAVNYGSFISQTSDGGAIFGGEVLRNQFYYQIFIHKYDSVGQTSVLKNETASHTSSNMKVIQRGMQLHIENGFTGEQSVGLYTPQGRQVLKQSCGADGKKIVDLRELSLSAGVYLLRVTSGQRSKQQLIPIQ